MKTKIKLPAILLGLLLLLTGTTMEVKAQGDEVSLQSFYDELSPYGQWIKDPQYGYVWRPDVDQEEFRPYYTNGRWVMTEYGNTWVSNYDWGWAPFHYGRWVYNRYNNWVWIPDTTWGPAWVTWRSGGGYYGWAPLGPTISIGINIGRSGYRIPDMCWNFVPYSNIYYSNYPRYYGHRNRVYIQNTVIINNTYIRNNRTYYTGPRADEIRRQTNQNVVVYNVNRSSRPGASRIDNNSVSIYNPRPVRGSNDVNAAPRNVIQGSINRGVINRDNAVSASRGERGSVGGYSGERNGSMNTNPSREGNTVGNTPSRGMENGSRGYENNGRVSENRSERESGNRYDPQRIERGSDQRMERGRDYPQTPQRVERPQSQPERVERGLPPSSQQQAPQRMERSQSQQDRGDRLPQSPQQMPQRMETRPQPQQQAPQRAERAERPQPQRVERSQSDSSQRGGGGESRGRENNSRESSGGGRVRGGK